MTTKQINETIEEGMSLKLISQAYTEIASNKLKRIRVAVEKNRYYLEDLSKVHKIVKQVASTRQILPQKNNRTISVLITSNYHFYGNVNNNLIKYFLASMRQHPTDQIIIGKTAIEYLTGIKYNLNYQKLTLKTDYPTAAELNALANVTKVYSQILVYYAEMKTVMVQTPIAKDITQTSYLQNIRPQDLNSKKVAEDLKNSLTVIFEPEIGKMLDFFETQVTNLLLEQTFLESELSRTASRLISMDQAQASADKYIRDQKKQLAQAKKTISNSKLLETYNSLATLKKRE